MRGSAHAILATDDALHVGGYFIAVGDAALAYYARFDFAAP